MSDLTEAVTGGATTPEKNDKPDRVGSMWSDAFRDLRRRPTVIVSVLILLTVYSMAAFPWLWTSVDPENCDALLHRQTPSAEHIFGMDQYGCDYYAMMIYGSQPTVMLTLIVTAVTLTLSIILGSMAGYFGGWVDAVISRVVEVFMSVPFFLGAILMIALFRDAADTILPIALILSATGWMFETRLLRSKVLELKNYDFVHAARSLGASHGRLMFRHILPGAIPPVLAIIPLNLAGIVSVEAALSFLGLGLQPPAISWGIMIDRGTNDFISGDHFLLLIPTGFLLAVVMSFVLLGDALRDALDPKLR
ncbi:ABC transporter permease [Stackebrandtia soli]|uniref:ABC transporter permease n=1 Tax=Stackebrandtia soli TaxID=1892856 RepID=UPI0039EB4893